MGRLTEYFGASTQRSGGGGSTTRDGDVEVSGFLENSAMLGRLLTTEPTFEKRFRGIIKKLLKQARSRLSKDAQSYMNSDPRHAARAVKYAVYKEMFGGNLSILQKRSRGALTQYQRKRTLRPGQRGGNRRKRNEDLNRLDKYEGADRGFILRFISSGTVSRQTRYGNRGSIRQSGWFGHTAPYQIDTVAKNLAEAINEYVKQQTNG